MSEMTEARLAKMYKCSYLLPDPGGEVARDLIAALRETRAERDRYRGLLHAEGIAEMHYCETHELGYQSAGATCPWCKLAAVEAERDRLKGFASDLFDAAEDSSSWWGCNVRKKYVAMGAELGCWDPPSEGA